MSPISRQTASPLMPRRTAPQPIAPPHNYLFIMPDAAGSRDHALVGTIAGQMAGLGYVYVASADQSSVEDRGAIRYLPFRGRQFPNFGAVDAVFVLRDHQVAAAALNQYPGAQAYVLEKLLPEA